MMKCDGAKRPCRNKLKKKNDIKGHHGSFQELTKHIDREDVRCMLSIFFGGNTALLLSEGHGLRYIFYKPFFYI